MWDTTLSSEIEYPNLRFLFEKNGSPTQVGIWVRNKRALNARTASRSRPITDALIRTIEVLYIMTFRPKLNVQNNCFDFKSNLKNGSHTLTKVSRLTGSWRRPLAKDANNKNGPSGWRAIKLELEKT